MSSPWGDRGPVDGHWQREEGRRCLRSWGWSQFAADSWEQRRQGCQPDSRVLRPTSRCAGRSHRWSPLGQPQVSPSLSERVPWPAVTNSLSAPAAGPQGAHLEAHPPPFSEAQVFGGRSGPSSCETLLILLFLVNGPSTLCVVFHKLPQIPFGSSQGINYK